MDKLVIEDLVLWIKNYVASSRADGVVVGMSGGKDSFVVAKLCVMALGKDKVFGVIMPNGKMLDKSDAETECEILGIKYTTISIESAYNSIIDGVKNGLNKQELSEVSTINTAPRLRMTMLYAVAGSMNYLVANTSNLSEAMVGYTTKWGDNVGDFAPIANFTKSEVCEIGLKVGLPEKLVNKAPSDGLSGKSDEAKLGFSYRELDDFIRNGVKSENFELIKSKHKTSAHKRNAIPRFDSKVKNYFYKK